MIALNIPRKWTIALVVVAFCAFVECIRVQHYEPFYDTEPVYRPVFKPHHEKEEQNLHKIPGVPGYDYPVYHEVPHTSFSCAHVPAVPGMYANVETGCQAYHVCHDGREGEQGASFLCTNGTIFSQKEFTCDWWYNVDCNQATGFYHLNADPAHNPYFPKKKLEDLHGGKFLIHP